MKRCLVVAFAACASVPDASVEERVAARIIDITVLPDGTFDPVEVTVHTGDTVVWHLADRRNAIVPVTVPTFDGLARTLELAPRPYVFGDPVDFTGPMPIGPGGVYSLNPTTIHPGLVESTSPCGDPELERARVGDLRLCELEPTGMTMASTWSDPSITGVFLRFNWSEVNPTEDVFEWTRLDEEIDSAVANGKLYSLGIEAGAHGTPDWIFSSGFVPIGGPPRTGKVPRLEFQDQGSLPDHPENCGTPMSLGSPTNTHYGRYYKKMLVQLASHLRERADRYRALAYIKPGGANMLTDENRLPKRCEQAHPECICNTEVWANAGYTPGGLEAFYADQYVTLATELPDKMMSYQLIQDGFPLVLDQYNYVFDTATDPPSWTTAAKFKFDAQTVDNIEEGATSHPGRFAVQHNGLQPLPADSCPGGDGCPNKWVTEYAANHPTEITGFQTQNITDITSSAEMDSALLNAMWNTTAVFVEVYEERLWEARTRGGPLVPVALPTVPAPIPVSRTVAWWDEYFRGRRGPTELTYSFKFTSIVAAKSVDYAEASHLESLDHGTLNLEP